MRIYTGGIATETNTFSPLPTGLADYDVWRSTDENGGDEYFCAATNVFMQMAADRGWDLVFSLQAFAQPAGLTVGSAYETLRAELSDALEAAAPVDMVLLPLHGAMVADGYDDCETDILHAVRRIVGADSVVGVLLDLHCDVTQEMVDIADLIVLYKEFPHTDIADRAGDLFELAAAAAEGRINPTSALFDCRMIGCYPTSYGPLRTFVDDMLARERKDGILSLSLVHGFPWADIPTIGTRMLAITDGHQERAEAAAEEWGRRFYSLRHQVNFDSLPVDEALDKALAIDRRPVVVADQADNPGGGAPSDSTVVLAELLRRGVTDAALGIMWDPVVVEIAKVAGVGATLDVRLGGKMGPASGDPLDLRVEVMAIELDVAQEWPQGDAEPLVVSMGDAVRLRCEGVDIIVDTKRGQVFSAQAFTRLGVDIQAMRLVVVKSIHHFYGAFAPIAAEIIYMSAPGAVAPRFEGIPYTRVDLNRYPWVDDPLSSQPVTGG